MLKQKEETLQVTGPILQWLKQEFLLVFQPKDFHSFTQLCFYWTLPSTWAFPKGLVPAEIQNSNYSKEKYINKSVAKHDMKWIVFE